MHQICLWLQRYVSRQMDKSFSPHSTRHFQSWRSQNAKNVTHIKGRLHDQAVNLFHCVPLQNGNFSYRKELAPRGSKFFPLRAVRYGMINHFYHTGRPPFECYYFYYAHELLVRIYTICLPITTLYTHPHVKWTSEFYNWHGEEQKVNMSR